MIDTSNYVRTLNGAPVAVYGLGVSGLATARALKRGGARVAAWDEDEARREAASREGIALVDFASDGFDAAGGYGALVVSPGIPLTHPAPHPVVAAAREAGVEILGDLEILHRCGHGRRVVGITGTNGKSTTTALVHHILVHAGIDAIAGGNLGLAALAMTLPAPDGVIVLEISSYQMDLCETFRPDVAVLLNVTPDHLDRHGGLAGYAAAKERIFEGAGDAICGVDDEPTRMAFDRLTRAGQRRAVPISVQKEFSGGVYGTGHHLIDAMDGSPNDMGAISIPTLPGQHNFQNLLAAYAVCRALGIAGEDVLTHAKSYPGLAHRQMTARVINGVAYVNDSKATNMEATARALNCYNNIYLIAGGRAKEGGLDGIEPLASRLRHVFLIGEAAQDFAAQLNKYGIDHTLSGTLDTALDAAHRMAQEGRGQPGGAGTVLLSPACASWDQFKSFEHRGEIFERLVAALPEEAA